MSKFLDKLHKELARFRLYGLAIVLVMMFWMGELVTFLIANHSTMTTAAAGAYASTMALIGGAVVWFMKHVLSKHEKDED